MKKILYFLAGWMMLASCFDDKGNYSYGPINEVSIRGFGNRDTTLSLLYLVDTLRIAANLECSMDREVSDENYTWRWELEDKQNFHKKIIAETRLLEFPMNVTPGKYELHLRVKDKHTGIVQSVSEPLNVELTYSKGLLVLGDRENGDVQLDMVAMIESKNDTIILRDMLKDTDLPPMKHGINVFHTGENDSPGNVRLWIMSESGSWYLESATMSGNSSNTFDRLFYTSLDVPADAHPVECYPRIAMGRESGTTSGFVRGFRLNDGSFVFCEHLLTELYNNPINRLKNYPKKILKLFPGCIYAARYLKAILVYDLENERFLGSNRPEYSLYLDVLRDMPGDRFPFDQRNLGRTLVHMENTRNPINADRGRSYALMKNRNDDYFIYCFYITDRVINNMSLKKGYWRVNKNLAENIDQAEKFLFSSTSQAFYYLVGSKIYCYSFNAVGSEKCEVVADFGSDEVTWWDVDLWTETTFDYIWVATYNPQTGGTLTKYQESEDHNKLEWTKTAISWTGFPKIKSVGWRNCSY